MAKLRGNPWAVLVVVSLGFFMTLLDLTIVNIAIPDMINRLHASLDGVLWVLNAYALVLAVLVITAGRLGDLIGPRTMFVAGIAVFTVWFLRDVGGVRAAGHGGSANGQFADLLLVPERGFAVVTLCNEGPDGIPFNQAVIRWALQNYLGITDRDPEPLPFDEARAREVAGRYENEVMTFTVGIDGAALGMGQRMAQRMAQRTALRMEVRIKPEIRAAADKEPPPDPAPFEVGLLPRDEYIVTGGEYAGQRGFFTRDASGAVTGVDLAGRLATRV